MTTKPGPHADRDHSNQPDLLGALGRSIDRAREHRADQAAPREADTTTTHPTKDPVIGAEGTSPVVVARMASPAQVEAAHSTGHHRCNADGYCDDCGSAWIDRGCSWIVDVADAVVAADERPTKADALFGVLTVANADALPSVVAEREALRAEVERLREGSDDSPRDPATWPSEGQLWHELLWMDREARLLRLAAIRATAMDFEPMRLRAEAAEAKVAAVEALADEWGYPVKYTGPAEDAWAVAWNQAFNATRTWGASRLRAALSGPSEPTCGADITHRDEEHRQSVCVLPAGHSSAHNDGQGCRWTDAEHYEPSEPTADPVLAYLDRLRAMGPSAAMRSRIDEVEQQHRAEQSWTAEERAACHDPKCQTPCLTCAGLNPPRATGGDPS